MKYIDADKLKKYIEHKRNCVCDGLDWDDMDECQRYAVEYIDDILSFITSLKQEQDKMRYCIEYVNPLHPLLDNGALNIRHLRIPDEHSAEMALTLMLSFGAKIYALYRGNVKEGKLDEWPAPMIVDADDWYSTDWLHDILDCGYTL